MKEELTKEYIDLRTFRVISIIMASMLSILGFYLVKVNLEIINTPLFESLPKSLKESLNAQVVFYGWATIIGVFITVYSLIKIIFSKNH